MLQGRVRGQDRVVRLHHGGCVRRSRIDAELQLRLLAVINGEALHQQGTETGAGATAKGVEHQEALQTRAVVGDTTDLIEDLVDHFLADGVVATSVVVGGILLARDHLFGVEEGTVRASADFIDDIRLQVAVDGARDVFALACSSQSCQFAIGLDSGGEQSLPVSEKKVSNPRSAS